MSRPGERTHRKPLIALVDRANRAMQADMVRSAHREGYDMVKPSHNAVFGFLSAPEGQRTVDLAQRAGITRQSMGEVVRDLVDLGILELVPDPTDGRAKLVLPTDRGNEVIEVAQSLTVVFVGAKLCCLHGGSLRRGPGLQRLVERGQRAVRLLPMQRNRTCKRIQVLLSAAQG